MQQITLLAAALAAQASDVKVDEVLSKRRYGNVPMARFLTWWLLRSVTEFSLPQIARDFDTDHTTVLKGIKRCEDRRDSDPDWRRVTDELKAHVVRSRSSAIRV